ncbi:MAG: RNA methyltransferase [Marinilabiliales bacterium]|nr:MAG: RNA methyltransferase [Marinilabiliales bacterium]
MQSFNLVAKTLYGLEEVLARELEMIGAQEIKPLNRAVMYRGDLEVMYKSNLLLRTAQKILRPIRTFEVQNENQLYKKLQQINWPGFFHVDQTFAVDGTTQGNIFTHSKFVALRTKDAIVDQFRDRLGKRPSVDIDHPDIRINIHISDMRCTVSMDSSGVQLGRRGYRAMQVEAPISETLAAGIILLSGWKGQKPFLDPMCGSGTFPIEAAMIAANIPPGRMHEFAFENWKDYDDKLWKRIQKEVDSYIKPIDVDIRGMDMDADAVKIASQNAKYAGVDKWVRFGVNNFLENTPDMKPGTIIVNPPYGERLKEKDEIVPFYQEIGTRLKHHYNGWEAWIISGNVEALKFIGLRPAKKIKLYNGPLESRLDKYELYIGSKKGNAKPGRQRNDHNERSKFNRNDRNRR